MSEATKGVSRVSKVAEAAEMAPNASPVQVSKKTGVRRVNDVPMYLIGAVLVAFIIVMMWVAVDRAAKQNSPREELTEQGGDTSVFAKEVIGDTADGIIEPALTPPPEIPAEGEPIMIARPDNPTDPLTDPPAPPRGLDQPARDDVDLRAAKLQMFEEAVRARTSVQTAAPRSSGSPLGGVRPQSQSSLADMRRQIEDVRQQIEAAQHEDPIAAYQARLQQMQGMGIDAPTQRGNGGNPNRLAQFQGRSDRWRLDSRVEAPSPYELRAGFVIPAVLISGINSDLPGQIIAQVSQNVYDTATGRHLLIPQGTRLVGSYSSDVAFGQRRVLVAWQRLVFPDGKALDIGAMPGSDSAGYAGFNDKVNNHYFRLAASALLMSGVTAGVALSQDDTASTGNSQRASDALSEALGQQLGQVTAQLIAKNLNVSPTIEIRPGYRFNVVVTKDITFSKPYRAFDY